MAKEFCSIYRQKMKDLLAAIVEAKIYGHASVQLQALLQSRIEQVTFEQARNERMHKWMTEGKMAAFMSEIEGIHEATWALDGS